MLTVTVNDRPLDVAAIVERGRVLLPMRATFTALGAAVRYDRAGRVIVARNAHHALRLQIGSKNALVDGRNVRLDVSARVVANRTYVPLRFVADAMGAVVGYDARANVVSVNAAVQHPASAAARGANVVALAPPPESVVASAYPTISASLAAANASRTSVTLTLDGQDVTAQSTFDGATITYMPRIGLMQGRHNVVFTGRTLANDTF
ncbi:MAG TPA: copper amine oxidase N-terminal domain-containing protein, partial [Candidatus Baltobacteraceae bacterium]